MTSHRPEQTKYAIVLWMTIRIQQNLKCPLCALMTSSSSMWHLINHSDFAFLALHEHSNHAVCSLYIYSFYVSLIPPSMTSTFKPFVSVSPYPNFMVRQTIIIVPD
jgi:hypothetical protein